MKLTIVVEVQNADNVARAAELVARLGVGPVEVMLYSRELAPVKLCEGLVVEIGGFGAKKASASHNEMASRPLPSVFEVDG